MSKTVILNSDETVWVTTYNGGGKGTCFDISVQLDDETQVTASFTKAQLIDAIQRRATPELAVRGLAKPEFERRQSEVAIAGVHKHFLEKASNMTTISTSRDGLSHYHIYDRDKAWTEVTQGHRHRIDADSNVGPPVAVEEGSG